MHLLDFVKLPLKCKENYETALGLVLQSHLKEYLSKFVVLFPGDWPHNFFSVKLYIEHVAQVGRLCQQILSPPWYHVWALYM